MKKIKKADKPQKKCKKTDQEESSSISEKKEVNKTKNLLVTFKKIIVDYLDEAQVNP